MKLKGMAERGRKGTTRGGDRKSRCAMELETLGVTKKQPHNWQKLAALDDTELEAKARGPL
jgi:hypothetical protein